MTAWRALAGLATIGALVLGTTASAGEVDKKVQRLWKAKCSSCHGLDGKADTEKGKKAQIESMATAEFQKKFSDDDLRKTILEGLSAERNGVKKEMDGYKEELKPEQVDALIAYIRSLAPGK